MNIAWATGLFEGEGCIYKDPRCNSVRLTVNSTDEDVLQRFFSIVGAGKIVKGKHSPGKEHHKPFWVWALHKKADVKHLLAEMLPMLGERRAYTALNALDTLDGVW